MKKYMQIALNEAQRAYEENEVPVGAYGLVLKNKIIAAAHNKMRAANDRQHTAK